MGHFVVGEISNTFFVFKRERKDWKTDWLINRIVQQYKTPYLSNR